MAKFTIEASYLERRTNTFELNILKSEVVKALDLTGEDKNNWRDYVQEYIEQDPDEIMLEAKAIGPSEKDEDQDSDWDWFISQVEKA